MAEADNRCLMVYRVRALVGIRMGVLAQKVAVKYGESVPYKNMFKVQLPAKVKIWIKEDISIVKRNFVLHKVYCMCVYSAYMSSCISYSYGHLISTFCG